MEEGDQIPATAGPCGDARSRCRLRLGVGGGASLQRIGYGVSSATRFGALRCVTWIVAGRPKMICSTVVRALPRQLLGLRLPTSAWCGQGVVPAMYSAAGFDLS